MAYFCGVALGRKIYKGPFLPDLSPNKTWEGFIGAGVFTVLAGWYLPMLWGSNKYMVCGFNDWNQNSHRLKKLVKDDTYSIIIDLEKGKEYQFRYFLDGTEWANEPNADKQIPTHFGDSENSVVVV